MEAPTATAIIMATYAFMFTCYIFAWAYLLGWGVRWAVPDPQSLEAYGSIGSALTRKKLLTTTIVIWLAQTVVTIGSLFVTNMDSTAGLVLAILLTVAPFVIAIGIISFTFSLTKFQALKAWLPTLLAHVALIAVSYLVLKPFIVQSFFVPNSTMAPTMLGPHKITTCATCGEQAFAVHHTLQQKSPCICSNFHFTRESVRGKPQTQDHFLVSKLLFPKRGDLVAFAAPYDPSQIILSRLIGLPGETITIEDGNVWIDGKKWDKPDDIKTLQYSNNCLSPNGKVWGHPNSPAKLGEDEYFVLSDFSEISLDSRNFPANPATPNANTYAVPKDNITGVVTTTYWPIKRWRAFK